MSNQPFIRLARFGNRLRAVAPRPLPPPRPPCYWQAMFAKFLRVPIVALALSALAPAASAVETGNFASVDGPPHLSAHLSRPQGDAPRAAPVLMHSCSGLLDG